MHQALRYTKVDFSYMYQSTSLMGSSLGVAQMEAQLLQSPAVDTESLRYCKEVLATLQMLLDNTLSKIDET